MCIREIVTPAGILVRFDDQAKLFLGLRQTLGLEPGSKPSPIVPKAMTIPIERPIAELTYSGRPCRMGSALSGRKIIRGY